MTEKEKQIIEQILNDRIALLGAKIEAGKAFGYIPNMPPGQESFSDFVKNKAETEITAIKAALKWLTIPSPMDKLIEWLENERVPAIQEIYAKYGLEIDRHILMQFADILAKAKELK